MTRIPIYQPDLSGNERQYVMDCLDSTWISSKGRYIQEFELAFASYVGSPHAVSVCNGTVALHLAMLALDIGPGDEVIVPSFTYVASVNAIRYVGAVPIFADSRADTWQIDIEHTMRLISHRTRAIMAVHIYGGAAQVQQLREICNQRSLYLVEDAAEAFGTRSHNRHVGNFGDIGTFSFFGNKTLTTGEGGMLVCQNEQIAVKLRHLRAQGVSADREYWHDVVGYNYRMTNICAAIGLAQLERADAILAAKIVLATRYRSALRSTHVAFQANDETTASSHWMITILLPNARQRALVRAALAEAGVETRPTFPPVHTMPMYKKPELDLPVAQDLAARGVSLPSWHLLSSDDVQSISSVITKAVSEV